MSGDDRYRETGASGAFEACVDAAAAGAVRVCASYTHARPWRAAAVIALALGGAWVACLPTDGLRGVGPRLFYVAILLTAVRFTWRTTALVAMTAGLLAGPWWPADLSADAAERSDVWLLRLGLFVLVGVCVALLVEDPEAALRHRLLDAIVSARLLRALDRGGIDVFYQPIYQVREHRLTGFEALARWRRPAGGFINPGAFIAAAERTGAVVDLDQYVLRRAVADARTWPRCGQGVFVSVNVSGVTLAQPELARMIGRILNDAGLPAECLQVEITESALIEDRSAAIRQIDALRARGVRVAIDDFGSRHASLNYLQSLPVDVVKLDRSIVSPVTTDERSRRLLEGVTHMCGLLALEVVAEGVELSEQFDYLSTIGVEKAQGYLLGRPASAGEAGALLNLSASSPAARRTRWVPRVGVPVKP